MKSFLYIFLIFLGSLGAIPLFSQPANDDLCNAVSLSMGASCTLGDNTGATAQSGEPLGSCFVGQNNSVWYSFVATSSLVWISTNTNMAGTTNDDTEIALYSLTGGNCAAPGNLVQIACDQDVSLNPINFLSEINAAPVTVGETYYVQVSGWSSIQGSFCIEVDDKPPHDDLCEAQELIVGAACTTLNGDNFAATQQAGEPTPSCFVAPVHSVWFSFQAPPIRESEDLDQYRSFGDKSGY